MSEDTATNIRFEAAVPQFTVPDLVRTAEYYRDVLGFRIAGYWDGERVSLVPARTKQLILLESDGMKESTTRSNLTPEGWRTVTPRLVARDENRWLSSSSKYLERRENITLTGSFVLRSGHEWPLGHR